VRYTIRRLLVQENISQSLKLHVTINRDKPAERILDVARKLHGMAWHGRWPVGINQSSSGALGAGLPPEQRTVNRVGIRAAREKIHHGFLRRMTMRKLASPWSMQIKQASTGRIEMWILLPCA
jgi:hypothetical protein